jgi:hypothetical protein
MVPFCTATNIYLARTITSPQPTTASAPVLADYLPYRMILAIASSVSWVLVQVPWLL